MTMISVHPESSRCGTHLRPLAKLDPWVGRHYQPIHMLAVTGHRTEFIRIECCNCRKVANVSHIARVNTRYGF